MRFLCIPALLALPVVWGAELDQALARLDRASQGFKGMQASVRVVSHTAVINDTTEESGSITIYRPKPKDTRMLVEFTKPDPRTVAFASRKLQMYYPKILTVQEYDLGKQSALIDQFLLLGFGSTSASLRAAYDVRWLDKGNVAGSQCDHLELTPRSEETRLHVRTIEMWLSEETGQPVQLKVLQPSRDYRLITYSNVRINPILTNESVRLKLPKGVKKETPQR
jgi:outer membrane lipoprotein-sorting protein